MQGSKTKKIAVIQFGQIQEIIFSLPSIIGLQKKFKDFEIDFFVSSKHKRFFTHQETNINFFWIDTKNLYKKLENKNNSDKKEIIQKQVKSTYQLVYNLEYSTFSSLFSGSLDAITKIGPHHVNNKVQCNDPWSQYNLSIQDSLSLNPFHLIDLYKYITNTQSHNIGLELKPQKNSLENSSNHIFTTENLNIGLAVNKHLCPKFYSRLIENILNQVDESRVYLIGTAEQESTVKEIYKNIINKKIIHRCHNLTDKLSSEDILLNCYRIDLLISNKSHILHIASGCGTPCIFIDDNAEFRTHGPYGHGHISIIKNKKINSESETIFNIISKIIGFISGNTSHNQLDADNIRKFLIVHQREIPQTWQIYSSQRSHVNLSNVTERTDLYFKNISSEKVTKLECFLEIYRLLWQFDLNGSEDISTDFQVVHKETLEEVSKVADLLEKLYKAASFGINYSSYIQADLKENKIEIAKKNSTSLQEVDDLISKISEIEYSLLPICSFFQISQSQIHAEDNIELTRLMELCYKRLQMHISIILDLNKAMIQQYKSRIKGKNHNQIKNKNLELRQI